MRIWISSSPWTNRTPSKSTSADAGSIRPRRTPAESGEFFLRATILIAVLAVPLCLAMSGCGDVAASILGSLDSDQEDPHDPLVIHSEAEDGPPSAILRGDGS